ncbi:hypothetical protein EL84_25940 [Paenibacillus sp. VT-400]|uniref:hypothetical protein n=1 Tax=Paenibacillus sp. VT-400 TaxID=1495853 RepID=UPI00064AF953|nr:hypothetical protein [Paenibacillus sp. VT-400]KLU55486.1 hypothetical protein EL84_25940 [Paenibacillus sp. VT-400]
MIDITSEDHTLLKSHIILPRVLTAFERDIALINATLKTPGPYVDVIAEAQRKLTADLYEVRKGFRTRGIKVYEEVTDSDGVTARYKCRGYESQMRIRWAFMSAEAGVLMRKYLGVNEGTRPLVKLSPE